MADNVMIVGKDGGVRTSSSAGSATKLNQSGPDSFDVSNNWKSMAGMAGGGALAYLLTDWLMGDKDRDEDGKKRSSTSKFLRWLAPLAAGAAGAYGGYGLMSPQHGKPGRKGEFAFKFNPETGMAGKIHVNNGQNWHRAGNVMAGVGAGTGAVTGASFAADRLIRHAKLDRKIRKLDALVNRFEINGWTGDIAAKAVEKLEKLKAKQAWRNEVVRKISINHPRMAGAISTLGKGGFRWGGLAGTLASLIGSGAAHAIGSNINADARLLRESLRNAGYNTSGK